MKRMYINKDQNRDIYYDFEYNEFVVNGEHHKGLSPIPEMVLEVITRDGATVTRDSILEKTDRFASDDKIVANDIKTIRTYFERQGFKNDDVICTVRGRGYKRNNLFIEFCTDSRTQTGSQKEISMPNKNDNILLKIDDIVKRHPDVSSYTYIHDLHPLLTTIEQNEQERNHLITELKDYISQITEKKIKPSPHKKAFHFTLYYILALFCKRRERIRHASLSLEKLIQSCDPLFKDYTLSLEICSWYSRRTQQLDKSFQYDKELISRLSIEKNAGVYNSFSSSVAQRLEKEYEDKKSGQSTYFWASNHERIDDWSKAMEYMPKAIEIWKETWGKADGYGKHYFIYGKLLLFSPRMGDLTPADRENKIQEASEQFQLAFECEQESPDSSDRKNTYKKYQEKCKECLKYWNSNEAAVSHALISDACTVRNKRENLVKPNEDYYVEDKTNRIYLIADGVTRPHDEYLHSGESLAAKSAQILCDSIQEVLLNEMTEDISASFLSAMQKGNEKLSLLRQYSPSTFFYPCTTFIGALIRDNTLFYSNCGDTMGVIIRDQTKITFSERHNAIAEKLKIQKSEVYQYIHNKIERPEGFAIFNGDSSIGDFLHVGHISLLPHDRIIIASDGLANFLYYTRAETLAEITMNEIITSSEMFDKPPFQSYADDKTVIIIDVKE
ncbi:MAG: hypothetical protein MJ071_09440 [Oscillospiraceae bacterium]|nr:hypothetical protein [Oscillospiraceae bacterium]